MLLSLCLLLFSLPVWCVAAKYMFPEYPTYENPVTLLAPSVSQTYYATLNGFPHNYELKLATSSEIIINLGAYDIATAVDKNVMVVKKNIDGSVSEVARINAKDVAWDLVDDPLTRETFQGGASFNSELPAGDYLIEVNSPSNEGVYALMVGQPGRDSYFNPLTQMIHVYKLKRWLGHSSFSVLESPVYYVPTCVIILGLIFWHRTTLLRFIRQKCSFTNRK